MFFRFSVLFLSILFALNLWASIAYEKYTSWFGIIFSLAIIIIAKLIVSGWRFVVLPVILVFGSVFLLSLVDTPFQIKVFIFSSSAIFYLTVLAGWRLKQYDRDKTAIAMYNIATIASLFYWYAASYGWYLNVPVPAWGLMIVFAVVTFFVSYVSFYVNQIDKSKHLIYSLFLALFIAQVIWIQNFWPFGYLTTSVVTLIIYYVSWSTIIYYFQGKANLRNVIFEIFFLVGSVGLILLSTNWYPVV